MICRLSSALIGVVLAGPAVALSCLPWGATDAYLEAAASKSNFVVVDGQLTFDDSLLPTTDWENQQQTPEQSRIPARIQGQSLSRAGYLTPFASDITLEVLCYGPWCAGATDGARYVMFLEQRPDGYVLQVNPCGGFAFDAGKGEAAKQVLQCHQGGRCAPRAGN
ncbi:hypothetical protein K3727_18380 [Rhodobacteraceae bacterium M382]|nr:hypothetical protein K3727_18380 [Rhodobacteraceae bacterium M382]